MTVRQTPDSLEHKIKVLAAQTGLSINKTVLRLLSKSVGLNEAGKVKRDVSAIAGTWSRGEAKEFNKSMEVFDAIDKELWSK
jgi:hypothetical protein